MVGPYLHLFNILNYFKIWLICTKFLKKKNFSLAKKNRTAKNLKIKLLQLECPIDKRTVLMQFFVTFSNKILLLECIFTYL